MGHHGEQRSVDQQAALLTQWATRYGTTLQRYFTRRISRGDEQDLVQEVYARLARRGDLDQVRDPQRYLFRTASNVLTDWHRSRRDDLHRPITSDDEFVDDAALPDRVVIGRDMVDHLIGVVATMPARTQAVFSLYHFEHMTHAQISQALGIAVRTVEDHMMRANAILIGHALP